MPTYPVKNLKTGEQKEIQMSMSEYDQWRKDNPDWDRLDARSCKRWRSWRSLRQTS